MSENWEPKKGGVVCLCVSVCVYKTKTSCFSVQRFFLLLLLFKRTLRNNIRPLLSISLLMLAVCCCCCCCCYLWILFFVLFCFVFSRLWQRCSEWKTRNTSHNHGKDDRRGNIKEEEDAATYNTMQGTLTRRRRWWWRQQARTYANESSRVGEEWVGGLKG